MPHDVVGLHPVRVDTAAGVERTAASPNRSHVAQAAGAGGIGEVPVLWTPIAWIMVAPTYRGAEDAVVEQLVGHHELPVGERVDP